MVQLTKNAVLSPESTHTITNSNSNIITGNNHKLEKANNCIIGGFSNTVKGNTNLIFGSSNTIEAGAVRNSITGYYNIIHEGESNNISGSDNIIAKGFDNNVSGSGNSLENSDFNIIGGESNSIKSGHYNIIGGYNNIINQGNSSSTKNLIIGDSNNTTINDNTIIGGMDNLVTNCNNSLIMGRNNVVLSCDNGIVCGWGLDVTSKNYLYLGNKAHNLNYDGILYQDGKERELPQACFNDTKSKWIYNSDSNSYSWEQDKIQLCWNYTITQNSTSYNIDNYNLGITEGYYYLINNNELPLSIQNRNCSHFISLSPSALLKTNSQIGVYNTNENGIILWSKE